MQILGIFVMSIIRMKLMINWREGKTTALERKRKRDFTWIKLCIDIMLNNLTFILNNSFSKDLIGIICGSDCVCICDWFCESCWDPYGLGLGVGKLKSWNPFFKIGKLSFFSFIFGFFDAAIFSGNKAFSTIQSPLRISDWSASNLF